MEKFLPTILKIHNPQHTVRQTVTSALLRYPLKGNWALKAGSSSPSGAGS